MSFQIKALPAATFAPLFKLSDSELANRAAMRVSADRHPGFPCRVSLRDAQVGETLLLVNFEHMPVANPYRSRHAIFVRENAIEAQLEVNEIPEVLLTRLLSLRAFDGTGMMVNADVVEGDTLALAIDRMLQPDRVHFLHVHNAKAGCFAARIERARA
jgi:hypothetical protein